MILEIFVSARQHFYFNSPPEKIHVRILAGLLAVSIHTAILKKGTEAALCWISILVSRTSVLRVNTTRLLKIWDASGLQSLVLLCVAPLPGRSGHQDVSGHQGSHTSFSVSHKAKQQDIWVDVTAQVVVSRSTQKRSHMENEWKGPFIRWTDPFKLQVWPPDGLL